MNPTERLARAVYDDDYEDGITRPDLTEINTHISNYVCGEGDYEATDTWAAHQAHHETHTN